MTREEAIRILTRIKDRINFETTDSQKKMDALNMAIQTLEQEPSGDAISRQAVLETLDDMDNVLDEDRTIENYKELLKECYEVLPSVKPQEPKMGHCKDCKHFRKLPYHADTLGKCFNHMGLCPKGDWYCADFEP